MKLGRIVLGVGGVVMTGVGVTFTIAPELLERGAGLSFGGPAGTTEIRAVYGGIELAIGVFLLLCAAVPSWRAPGLVLAALVGGLAGGARVLGLVADGVDWKNVLWASLELAGGAVALYALLRLRRDERSGSAAPEPGAEGPA